jgi:hypothetical protein
VSNLCHKCALENRRSFYDLVYRPPGIYTCERCGAQCAKIITLDYEHRPPDKFSFFEHLRHAGEWVLIVITCPLLLLAKLVGFDWEIPYPKGKKCKKTD